MVIGSIARRSSSVCLSCQIRQSLLSRRLHSIRRSQSTAALLADQEQSHSEDDFLLPPKPQSTSDLSFSALTTNRDLRLAVLSRLRNPWPPHPSGRQHHSPRPPFPSPTKIPHTTFRASLKSAFGDKAIRQILRIQLLQCSTPTSILRVIAAAMTTSPATQLNIAILEEPLIRALYRCRANISDPEVLRTLNTIIWRFELAENVTVDPHLRYMALKFAARARSLKSMKRHLRALRREGRGMSSNMFRSIIAKCSIGHRGLGEIRNGRWKRGELLQVLMGFEDDTEQPPCHLGSFLVRDDWQFLHGWVAVLARCKESEAVWREWEAWKVSPSRRRARALERPQGGDVMTTRSRGDYWFLEQIVLAGDYERAWRVLGETRIGFGTVKQKIRDKMLDGVEFATVWDEGVRAAMVEKWDRELGAVERALGVKWVGKHSYARRPGDDIIGRESDAEGWHELFMDQEEALERLGDEGWKLKEDYGYPYDDEDVIVPHGERELHEAVEVRV